MTKALIAAVVAEDGGPLGKMPRSVLGTRIREVRERDNESVFCLFRKGIPVKHGPRT